MEGIKINRVLVFLVLVVGIFGLQNGVFYGVDAGRAKARSDKPVHLPNDKPVHLPIDQPVHLPGDVPDIPEDEKKVLVQYFGQQSVVTKDFYPWQVDFAHLTHVIYASLKVSKACTIESTNKYVDFDAVYSEIDMDWVKTPLNRRGNIGAFFKLKSTHDFKFLVSIGGKANITAETSKYISTCLSDITTRTTLVDSAVDLVDDYAVDGIDFYWQYPEVEFAPPTVEPTSSSSTSTSTPVPPPVQTSIENIKEDGQNLLTFLQDLKTALDDRFGPGNKLLSVAQSGKYDQVIGNPVHAYCEVTDFMNLIPYKFEGDWGNVASINDPLYNDNTYIKNPTPHKNINWFVSTLISRGCPANKLVMGIPLYGQGWKGAKKGLYKAAEGKCHGIHEDGLVSFWDINQNYLPNEMYVRQWSFNTRTPYIWNGDVLVSYDDEDSINDKVLYARDNEMKGYLLYEASDDHQFILTSAAYDTWSKYEPPTTSSSTTSSSTTSSSTTSSSTTSSTIPPKDNDIPTIPNCQASKAIDKSVNDVYCIAVCSEKLKECGNATDKIKCVNNLIPQIDGANPCQITAKAPSKRI